MGKRIVSIFLIVLLACTVLCGCDRETLADAVTAGLLEELLRCMEENDAAGFAAMFYPMDGDPAEQEAVFAQMREYWPDAKATDAYALTGISTQVKNGVQQSQLIYLVSSTSGKYYVALTYLEENDTAGLTGCRISSEADRAAVDPKPAQPFHGIVQVLSVIFLTFSVFTVADVLRNRIRRPVLWILLSLACEGVSFSRSAGGMSVRVCLNILPNMWVMTQDGGGAISFALMAPLGCILYWCLRKKLLKDRPMISEEQESETGMR